jgi:hypothetical protein
MASGVSDSAIRVVQAKAKIEALRALLGAPDNQPAPVALASASVELEARVASTDAEVAPLPTSATTLRAEQAEAENAALRAELEAMKRAAAAKSAPKSESAMRVEKANAEAAKLQAQLEEMRRATAAEAEPNTSGGEPPAAKSASRIRAEEAEAAVAKLQAQLDARQRAQRAPSAGHPRPPLPPQLVPPAATRGTKADKKSPTNKMAKEEPDFARIQEDMRIKAHKAGQEVKARLARANTLDLVIVMDCTASMDPWIEAAKSSIIAIIDNVKVDHPSAKVRVGFVAYRDFCDGDKRLESHPLTDEIDSVRAFIAACRAFGGGDEPEDLAGALQCAMEMKFQADGKRVIVVTDAPCHGEKYHDSRDSKTYANQIASSPDMCKLVRRLARGGVDFTFIEIKPPRTAKMLALLEHAYTTCQPANGLEPEFQRVELKEAGDIVRFANVVQDSASSSLTASKGRSVMAASRMVLGVSTVNHYGPTGQRSTTLSAIDEDDSDDDAEAIVVSRISAPDVTSLEWAEVLNAPKIPAVRHSFRFPVHEKIDWTNPNLKHTRQDTVIQVLPTCFAKGAMRSAHAMYDCKLEIQSVAKFYFKPVAGVAGFDLENDVEMQIMAKQLATEFSLDPRVEDTVDFIFTCWYEIEDPAAAGLSPSMTKFTAEPYIGAEYQKYNSNTGWKCAADVPLADTAQAFSHFTWQATKGKHLVVDLQGVDSVFTDPQIHSVEATRFGVGNLSTEGIVTFFSTHECNSVCRALSLGSFGSSLEEEEAPEAKRVLAKDKSMTCSCPLCGAFLTVLRSEFLIEHEQSREIYCKGCTLKFSKGERRPCRTCKNPMRVKPYWFDMKGVDLPSVCKSCARATK